MVGSKLLIDDESLDKGYQRQMENWRKATEKKHWSQLLPVTGYFFADERNQKELQSPTITKTLKTRPMREDGIYNLLTLVGALYVLGGITGKATVEAFFAQHYINLPSYTTWHTIWQHIDEATDRYRSDAEQLKTSNAGQTVSPESSPQISESVELTSLPNPISICSTPSSPKRIRRLRIGLIASASGVFNAAVGVILAKPKVDPASEVGAVTLVGSGNQLLTLQAGTQTISAKDEITLTTPIAIGETVTDMFKIQNTYTHPVRIETFSGGAQRPSRNEADWSSPQSPLPPVTNILLQPGETYEYSQSRAFFVPGHYFVEPTVEDAFGNWGGIQPFTRIHFMVK